MATDDVTPLRDELAFLTALHATRFYFLVFDRQLQRDWDAAVDVLVREEVVPRLADAQKRTAYESGFFTKVLTGTTALEADRIYDEEFPTQRDYVGSLTRFVDELVGQADTALLAALLRLHIRIGNALADQASLTVQDRYFLPFLLLLRAPTIPLPLLDEVLDGIDDSSARALLRRASGHPETLVARERLALALFDMILLREEVGFDIKLADIARATQLVQEIPLRDARTTAHPSHAAWTDLVGTFEGNLAAEIFKFFNAGLLAHAPQDAFHAFCLRAWTLLQPELDADGRDAVLQALDDGFHVERDREIPMLEAYRVAAGLEVVGDEADAADTTVDAHPDGDVEVAADSDENADPSSPTGDMLLDFLRAVGIWPVDLDPWSVTDPSQLPEGFDAATAALVQHIRQSPSWFELPHDVTMPEGLLGLSDPVVNTCTNDEFGDLPGAEEYPWHKRGPLWYSSRLRINGRYDGPVLFLRDAFVAIDPEDDARFTILSWDDFLGHRVGSDGATIELGAVGFDEPTLILTHQDALAWSKASLAVASAVLARVQPVAAESAGEAALRHPAIEPWTAELLQELLALFIVADPSDDGDVDDGETDPALPDWMQKIVDEVVEAVDPSAAATPPDTAEMQGPFALALDVADVINFASTHAGIPIIRRLELRNRTTEARTELTLRVTITCDALDATAASFERRIQHLEAEDAVAFDAIPLRLDAGLLARLDEAVGGSIEIRVEESGIVVAQWTRAVRLLAHNEFFNQLAMAELVAAHIQPNHPAVVQVLQAAGEHLRRTTGDSSLQGYQAGPERARLIASAIYEALRGFKVGYVDPPASFEDSGQKIRTPAQVIDDRLGTCLDLACTYAACLEQVGLNPVLCLIRGHAFGGVFLDGDLGFRDPSLRKLNPALNVLDAGKLITVETIAYTSGSDLDFDTAVADGRAHWNDPEEFRAVVDVRAARRHGVLPLPARVLRDGQVTVIVEEKVVQAAPVVVTTVQPVVAVPRDRAAAPPRIQQWKKSLLDLSLRNPLLNLNTKRSGLGVLVPTDALALVEDILMGGHGLRLFAHDQLTQLHRERGARSVADIDVAVRRELLTKERMLHVDASEDALARRLRGLREKARLAEEEGGTNILHLTIGSLHWTDPVKGKTVRSPILLLPVRLHAMGRGKPMELRADPVGGTVHNFVLLEKLRQTFRLQVPELERLTDDASGIDVMRALDGLRAAIARDELDMRVDDDAAIALLQFGKYRMWKDLDDHWERFLENPVVRHLVERPGQPFQRPVPLPDVATLDDEPVFCPIPCDGTQLEAIVAAAKGASFVLEGPPGTGKSQTITNMIANALAAGKRVLFVAEKRAALTVVKNRLTAVGLGPFCLDVHGKGTDLESLKTQLASSFNRVANGDPAEWEGTRRDLTDRMGTLRAYVQALHETGAHGFSVWTARQRLMSLGEGPALRPAGGALAPEAFDAVRKLVSDFADRYAAATAGPGGNPWGFVEDGAVADQVEPETLRDVLQGVRSALSALEPSVIDVLRPLDAAALAAVATLHGALTGLSAPQRQGILALSSAADAPYARLLEALHAIQRSASAVDQWFRPSIQTADPARLRAALEAARTSFLLGRGGRVRKAMTAIAPHLRRSGATEADVVRALGEAADLAARAAEVSAQARVVLGATLPPDWAALAPESRVVVERLVQARRALAEAAQGPAGPVLDRVLRVLPPGVEVEEALGALLVKLTAFRAQLGVSELTFAALVREGGGIGTLIDRLPAWQADAERGFLQLRRWSVVATTLDRLTASGFSARGELQAGRLEAAAVASAVERGNVRAAFDERLRASRLDRFDGLEHQRALTRYQALYATDAQMLKEVIPDRLLRARRFKPGEAFGEVGNLKRNVLDARKAKLSIRQLLKQYCKAIGELTPCFLMSPDSVAQFIEPGVLDFDLVIFDEASQVSVPDAIGAIARGRSLVVVGDSRQMPPTAFFGSGAGEEEDAPVDGVELAVPEDLESILSECVGANIDRIWLSWHYRSQAESLIAFSNAKYYEGRLASFPPPRVTGGAAGVRWCKVSDAIFDRGRTATNPREADAVVAEIQARLRAAGDRAASMGVVTFNINQADLISERLEAAALGDKALDAVLKEEDPERRLFVKNLENVQGDERDVILISIGFGRDRDGEFLMNFGPLNRAGGERRWNVAVTRARQEVMLFSSIEPEEIDLARVGAGADGVRHLRAYMELARDGVSRLGDVAALGQHGPDAHREAIAEALRAAGLQVDTDIGLSSFKVDLALAHPEAPERQLVAVLLDGPTYARRRTVQDREGLPVSVLERLMKWDTTFRIWLPQWNAEPERVIEDVKQLVERLHAKAATAPAPVGPSEMGPTTGSRKTLAGRVVLTPAADVRLAAPEFRSYEVRLGDLGDTAALEAAIARPGAGVLLRAADEILAIEGPTEMTRLGRLLGRRFGLERVRGDRITAMAAVLPRERLRTAGERTFVWPQDLTPETWRGFRRTPPGTDRPLECIAPEEVRNAILEIATKGLSVTDGDIVDALAELFGILRVTTSIRGDLLTHLRSAVAAGVLRQAGDRYEVA